MNLSELSAEIDRARHIRRLETLPAYASSSDVDWPQRYLDGGEPPDPAGKQPWLDRLRAAADAGRPRERLRLIHAPVTGYERYACEWGYVDNTAAGEVIRVIDAALVPDQARAAEELGDLYVLDDAVVLMRYDEHGAFQSADEAPGQRAGSLATDLQSLWGAADAFHSWWTMRTDLHRARGA